MKEGWEYKKLGDVCEILDSKRKPITKGKREPGPIPYYGATGIIKRGALMSKGLMGKRPSLSLN